MQVDLSDKAGELYEAYNRAILLIERDLPDLAPDALLLKAQIESIYDRIRRTREQGERPEWDAIYALMHLRRRVEAFAYTHILFCDLGVIKR